MSADYIALRKESAIVTIANVVVGFQRRRVEEACLRVVAVHSARLAGGRFALDAAVEGEGAGGEAVVEAGALRRAGRARGDGLGWWLAISGTGAGGGDETEQHGRRQFGSGYGNT